MRITTLPVYSKLADPADIPDKLAEATPADVKLSQHQLETYRALTNPDVDVVINTAMTGDGKSLAGLLPLLVRRQHTLALYPTNELIRDQLQSAGPTLPRWNKRHTEDSLTALFGAKLDELCEEQEYGRRGDHLLTLLRNYPFVLSNPDIFHAILQFAYYQPGRAPDWLVPQLVQLFQQITFDEFHIFDSAQVAAVLSGLLLLYELKGNYPLKTLFLSATPGGNLGNLLKKTRFDGRVAVVEGTYLHAYEADPQQWRPILQPCGITFSDQTAHAWLDAHLENTLLAFFKHHGKHAKGAIIVNSVATAHLLLERLQPIFAQHGLSILPNTGITGQQAKAASRQANVLIGTSTVDVGVDFQINFLLFESGDAETFIQRLGRLGRHRAYTDDAGNSYPFHEFEAYALVPPFLYQRLTQGYKDQPAYLEDDQQIQRDQLNAIIRPATHRQQVRQIVAEWCKDLALDQFLAPLGPIESLLDDLILIASNTQVQWGTMRYLAALPDLSPQWQHEVALATQLCTLADYLAYVGKTPIEAAGHTSIGREIQDLSNRTARLTYHHIADLRGVLTNIINNAAVDAYAIPGQRVPILYAPSGVVYLERTSAAQAAPDLAQVADAIASRIRAVCRDRLSANLIGFTRAGKGLRYAPFYDLFFTPRQLPAVIAKAAHARTAGGKTSAAGTRYAKMVEKGMVPSGGSVDGLPTQDTSVDMLAEGIAKIEQVMRDASPELEAQQWLLERLGLGDIAEQMREIPTLANMGGVPYPWYYAAGVLYRRTPGLDREEWRERLEELAQQAGAMLPDEIAAGGGGELRTYILANLRFEHTAGEPADVQQMAAQELQRYGGARRIRGATQVCSLCSSSFSVSEQRESGILFAPMVYTNKQPLHGNKAIRSICAICEMEMMLRQVLMNNSAAVGKKFEGRRLRYLFFYPTYFFTPETLQVLQDIYTQMQRMRFTALRKLLLPDGSERTPTANLEPETYQRLEDLLLDPTLPSRPDDDRLFRMRFSEGEPVSFGIVGIPPASRKAKDAEAWVHPAFLALVLPLLIDIKVVASESMLPLFNEATELPETVAFDGPHQFINYIIGQNRLNLDQLGRALQRLTAAYLIHLEGNARSGSGGYDYHWNDIPALARNLSSSPLYAFHYIKKGMRQEGGEAINTYKATLYNDLVEQYLPKGEEAMSHARELTTRYRRFYRHKKLNSNGVLRPISEASKALLSADLRLFDDDESLVEIVRGRLEQFVERVEKKHADGAVPIWLYTGGDRPPREAIQLAVDDFSRYFVETIYRDVFQGDRAALAGKQLNLLKNACESIYMAEQRREWNERGQTPEEKLDEPDLDENE